MLRLARRHQTGLRYVSIAAFTFLITACGGDSSDGGSTGTTNQAPVFETAASLDTPENQADVATLQANDADGDTLTYTLTGGADASLFTLDGATGSLAFLSAPDFEAPGDSDTDNDYELSLTVTDGQGGSDSLDLVISVTNVQQIQSTVVFPPPGAQFGGHVDQSALVGRLEDVEGGTLQAGDISYVDVDGSLVSPDAGNPILWRTSLPLAHRIQTLPIEVAGVSGPAHQSEATFDNAPFMETKTIDVDEANNRVVIGGISGEERILGVDLASGESYEIAGCTGLYNVRDLHVGESGDTLAVLASERVGSAELWLVDTTSGQCSRVSQTALSGAGSRMDAVLLDEAGNRVFTLDTVYEVVAVTDLDTGDFQVFSGGGAGAGPAFEWVYDFALDAANDRLLVTSAQNEERVYGVDLATGERTILSAAANMLWPRSVAAESSANVAWVRDGRNFQSIDLASGVATDVALNPTAFGYPGVVGAFAVDQSTGNLLLAGSDADRFERLYRVATDPVSSTEITNNHVNAGDGLASTLAGIEDMVVDRDTDRAWILTYGDESGLIQVDLNTGDRSADSLPYMAGDQLLRMTQDPANARLIALATNTYSGDFYVQAINESDYQVTQISDFSTGPGPALQSPRDLTLDTANNRILFVDSGLDALLELDLATGEHRVISDGTTGAGTAFDIPKALLLDTANDRVLVVDGTTGVMAVDLTTGDRTDLVPQQPDGTNPDRGFSDLVFDQTATGPTLLGVTYSTVRRIDLNTGVVSLVTGTGYGVEDTPGHQLTDLQAIHQDPTTGLLWVAGDDTLSAIEGASGQRAIFSR